MEYVLLDNNCNESVIYNEFDDDEMIIVGDEEDYKNNVTNTLFLNRNSFLKEIKNSYKDIKRIHQTAKFDAIRSNLLINEKNVNAEEFLEIIKKDVLLFIIYTSLIGETILYDITKTWS